jgi:hypothetical protein
MKREPRLRDIFVVVTLVLLVIVYFAGALSTEDPLWFWPFFSQEPERIVIHHAGQETVLTAGSPGYTELTQAINSCLSRVAGFQGTMGLSEATMKEYMTKELVLEVFYAKPVFMHVPFRFTRPNSLFIPLTGRLSEAKVVFGGLDAQYRPGALILKTTEPLKEALEAIGY